MVIPRPHNQLRIGFDKFEQLLQGAGTIAVIVGHLNRRKKPELGLYRFAFDVDVDGFAWISFARKEKKNLNPWYRKTTGILPM